MEKKSTAVWAGMTDRAMTEWDARRRWEVQGEASNRVGRNDRLGCGRERKESWEKNRGQEVGGSQEPSGPE